MIWRNSRCSGVPQAWSVARPSLAVGAQPRRREIIQRRGITTANREASLAQQGALTPAINAQLPFHQVGIGQPALRWSGCGAGWNTIVPGLFAGERAVEHRRITAIARRTRILSAGRCDSGRRQLGGHCRRCPLARRLQSHMAGGVPVRARVLHSRLPGLGHRCGIAGVTAGPHRLSSTASSAPDPTATSARVGPCRRSAITVARAARFRDDWHHPPVSSAAPRCAGF